MSMNVTTGGGAPDDEKPMSEINTTPLVDVMLVLLIIFLITVPVITQSVRVDLPKAANIPTQTKPENINIAVDKDGNVYWNTALVPTQDKLLAEIKRIAQMDPQRRIAFGQAAVDGIRFLLQTLELDLQIFAGIIGRGAVAYFESAVRRQPFGVTAAWPVSLESAGTCLEIAPNFHICGLP